MTSAKVIVAVDESGMGSLAGPITVAAVAFLAGTEPVATTYLSRGKPRPIVACDSKKLTNPAQRIALDTAIRAQAYAFAIAEKTSLEIDQRLLHVVFPEALTLAIARCMEVVVNRGEFRDPADFLVVIDGEIALPNDLPCPARAIPGGDATVWQIGAASIIAKVLRDQRMDELHIRFPAYGFDKHRGYPTRDHKQVLTRLGPSKAHRLTFKPVRLARGPRRGVEV